MALHWFHPPVRPTWAHLRLQQRRGGHCGTHEVARRPRVEEGGRGLHGCP